MQAPLKPGREEAIAELVLCRKPLTDTQIDLFHDAYREHCAAHLDGIAAVIVQRGVPEADRDDTLQNVLESFFFETCADGFPASIRAQLYWKAMTKGANARRAADRDPWIHGVPSSSSEPAPNVPSVPGRIDALEAAKRLFYALSPDHQAVIQRIVIDGMSHAEAAIELRVSRTTLTSRLAAAITRLKEMAEAFFTDSERTPR